jgi:hypothetical protein
MIEDARSSWTDQVNWLYHMHNLEKKMFERSVEFFFDNRYGGYMLDDELISSKASDIEHKVVSDRKSGGEGPTCDCFCDSYVQLILGMRVRSSGDTQLFNVEKFITVLSPLFSWQLPFPSKACRSMIFFFFHNGTYVAVHAGSLYKTLCSLLLGRT